LTVGKLGIGGNSGISISGNTGNEGIPNNSDKEICTSNHKLKFGTSGKYKFGNLGNKIGFVSIANSGKAIFNHALILCKSIIISGHFGHLIIGIVGIRKSTALNSESKASCLSFLHS